ncbi:zinc ribbon domain-containing protein [Companilactobacillus mishanensis]|uniref:Zinc-ribbon domain-containing protein n=1 Tax=Companilactobacillus mishanensis TaxID=2486008 RepID=A0A5P0ZHT8_9LACO|nr:zinc-ribbon domain-containing protein [Companilactobacillus mishanensis]MQS52545.1 zinc-ribbon domain-containing protein [Companilactobacillus mishanensis]
MVCPNCGHEISPSQNFCENCGLPLKKGINFASQPNVKPEEPKKDDSIKSLSDIENELEEQEKQEKAAQKPATDNHDEPEVDDKTRVYDFRDSGLQQAPAQKKESQQSVRLDPMDDPISTEHPIPTPNSRENVKAQNTAPKTDNAKTESDDDEEDGLLQNMWKFLKNNIYLDIIAVVLVVALFFIKKQYSWILLVAFLIVWFLTSQIVHGNEVKLNKRFKRSKNDKEDAQQAPQNPQKQNTYKPYEPPYQGNGEIPDLGPELGPDLQPIEEIPGTSKHHRHEQPKEKQATTEKKVSTRRRNIVQKLIIISSIVGFIATCFGTIVNGYSLSTMIGSAANSSANVVTQTALITNLSSAIRFICFLSPIIVLIMANFRSRGSIRTIRIFSILSTIIYVAVYAIFITGIVDVSQVTGVATDMNVVKFGYSFYVLLGTSVLSWLMSYMLRPKNKK